MRYINAYNKITKAYLNNELNQNSCTACFIGNLLNNKSEWSYGRSGTNGKTVTSGNGSVLYDGILFKEAEECIRMESNGFYTIENIVNLENNFLGTINKLTLNVKNNEIPHHDDIVSHPNYENALFEAMESTLEMLKQIHIKNGDESLKEEELPVFKKRELVHS